MRILVAGTPRSGSTWTGRVLACAEDTRLVFEPDSFVSDLAAAPTVKELGHLPVLDSSDRAPEAYARVWELAFVGGWPWAGWKPAIALGRQIRKLPATVRDPIVTGLMKTTTRMRPRPHHTVVKSVNASLSIEWVATHFKPTVVVTTRNPIAVVSSWRDVRSSAPFLTTDPRVRERFIDAYHLPDPPASSADELTQIAWSIGLLTFATKLACDRHPDWIVVEHEAMCADPGTSFRELFGQLGLTWTPSADDYLASSNRPGEGFDVARVTHDAPHRWRSRLSRQEIVAVQRVLSRFPLALEAV